LDQVLYHEKILGDDAEVLTSINHKNCFDKMLSNFEPASTKINCGSIHGAKATLMGLGQKEISMDNALAIALHGVRECMRITSRRAGLL